MEEVSNILGKDEYDLKTHYSLRKLGTGLASVLIGLNMFELAVKPNKVQADAVTDKTLKEESSQRQFGDKFAIFGKIIPVNEKNEQQINSDDLDKLAFGTFQNENVEFKVSLVRKKILLTAENATGKIDPKELIFRTNLTIHFSGAGDNTPKNIVENAV